MFDIRFFGQRIEEKDAEEFEKMEFPLNRAASINRMADLANGGLSL